MKITPTGDENRIMMNETPSYKTHVALICHGSRDPKWCQVFEGLVSQLQIQNPTQEMKLCYMEIASPTLLDLVTHWQASEQPFKVRVLPLFMASGGHVDHDIPAQIAMVSEAFPELDIVMERPIGENPLVISAIGDIVRTLAQNSLV